MIRRQWIRAVAGICACMLVAASLGGCNFSGAAKSDGEGNSATITEESLASVATELGSDAVVSEDGKTLTLTDSDVDVKFTDRDTSGEYDESAACRITFNGTTATVSGSGATAKDGVVTISGAGTYVISGTASEGQLVVDATKDDKIQLVLDNASIACDKSAAIYVKKADKVFVTLKAGTSNTLSGGSEYQQTDDNTVDGVIFSKSDLTINGSGALAINANYKHGVVSKDTLCVTGGTINVKSVGTCLTGKDGIKIAGGTFTLDSQNKGMKAENEDDSRLGNLYIAGGTFTIKSEDDALHAVGSLVIDGGTFTIDAGDDGIHSEADTIINAGDINITNSYEGLEGKRVTITGGKVALVASDDGINAADGSSTGFGGGFGGGFGKGGFGKGSADNGGSTSGASSDSSDVYIKITGGEVHVNASGDGLDSNDTLEITGGTIYVSGPTSNNDGAIDYETTGTISGGTIIAVGSTGMAEGFSDSSTQCSLQVGLNGTQAAGSKVELKDSSGKVLVSFTPEKAYGNVVVSTPDMKQGEEYTLVTGETETKVTLSGVVTTSGNGGGFGGGGFGGGNGGRGDMKNDRMDGSQQGQDGQNGQMPEMPSGMDNGQNGQNGQVPEMPGGMQDGNNGNNGMQDGSKKK